jgi:hypothetical protein
MSHTFDPTCGREKLQVTFFTKEKVQTVKGTGLGNQPANWSVAKQALFRE